MTSYAIGDVQGCLPTLHKLLDRLCFDSQRDTLWFCGDLVNRGPDSLNTLRFIKSLGGSARVVLGNHDLHALALAHGVIKAHPKDTLEALLKADDSAELLHWLRQQKLIHCDPDLGYVMVHAGIPPQWTLLQALEYAQEVEGVLRSDSAADFYPHMYGNEPACWHEDLHGFARLRVITNYLTRMRFCTADGTLELKHKGGLDKTPQGFSPWYKFRTPQNDPYHIVFGHWSLLNGDCPVAHIHALDTGCVWGGPLTAMNLETRERIAVNPVLK